MGETKNFGTSVKAFNALCLMPKEPFSFGDERSVELLEWFPQADRTNDAQYLEIKLTIRVSIPELERKTDAGV